MYFDDKPKDNIFRKVSKLENPNLFWNVPQVFRSGGEIRINNWLEAVLLSEKEENVRPPPEKFFAIFRKGVKTALD